MAFLVSPCGLLPGYRAITWLGLGEDSAALLLTGFTMAPKPKAPMKATRSPAMKARKVKKATKAPATKAMKVQKAMKATPAKAMKAMKVQKAMRATAMKAMKVQKAMKAAKPVQAMKRPSGARLDDGKKKDNDRKPDDDVQTTRDDDRKNYDDKKKGDDLPRPEWAKYGLQKENGEIEVQVLEEGRWICTQDVGLSSTVQGMLSLAEDPGCSQKKYRAVSVAVVVELYDSEQAGDDQGDDKMPDDDMGDQSDGKEPDDDSSSSGDSRDNDRSDEKKLTVGGGSQS